MHVRIRVAGNPEDIIVPVQSKLTTIDKFRQVIHEKLNVPPKLQILFYGGKLLENGYTLYDYKIKLNDVIQLIVKSHDEGCSKDYVEMEIEEDTNSAKSVEREYTDAVSTLFKVGDLVDMRDQELGAWLEGKITRIVQDPDNPYIENANANDKTFNIISVISSDTDSDVENKPPYVCDSTSSSIRLNCNKATKSKQENQSGKINSYLLYKVELDTGNNGGDSVYCQLKDIRPRARHEVDIADLSEGEKVMVNYNIHEPTERGHWYDFKVSEIKKNRTGYELVGTVYLGPDAVPQNDTKIIVKEKIYKIEEVIPIAERTKEYEELMVTSSEKRTAPFYCLTCHDDEKVQCKDCGCCVCLNKNFPEKILLCDECNNGYHTMCLSPPLESLPKEDWYCPSCKRDPNDVIAPGASKQVKKTTKSTRDWGRGMACVGKTKTCPMPSNHFGPIPGIEVGMCWRFRIQLAESGVHRPPVSGIHGRDTEGAYSIVLSGGYEDDVDNGYEFTYTGSGGRDLSGNKRTAVQSWDQTLSRENRALARNCAVKEVSERGGDAGDDWRSGKPVRVVRSYKMRKHFPKYAPKEGIRYDGIYKVVKYYPEKGLSGYRVWKYLLRRDDPNPAPWEPEATKYTIVYPDGYLEAEAEKRSQKRHLKSSKNKRKIKESNQTTGSDNEGQTPPKKPKVSPRDETSNERQETNSEAVLLKKKKSKPISNKSSKKTTAPKHPEPSGLSDADKAAIKADTLNSKCWEQCLAVCDTRGKKEFVECVAQEFLCIICQEVVVSPVTTPCLHNFCMECIQRAFLASGVQCPHCRQNLADCQLQPNEQLKIALQIIMPGYDAGKK